MLGCDMRLALYAIAGIIMGAVGWTLYNALAQLILHNMDMNTLVGG